MILTRFAAATLLIPLVACRTPGVSRSVLQEVTPPGHVEVVDLTTYDAADEQSRGASYYPLEAS